MALRCSPGISSTVYFVQSWLSFKMLICLCHEFFLNHFNLIKVFAFPESKWSFAPFQLIFHLSILILIFLFFFVSNLKLFICWQRLCLIWFYFISHRTCVETNFSALNSLGCFEKLQWNFHWAFSGYFLKNQICYSVYSVYSLYNSVDFNL